MEIKNLDEGQGQQSYNRHSGLADLFRAVFTVTTILVFRV